jgi:DNA-binding CsgD family transcriptional regulator
VTARQAEVRELIARHLTNAQIGETLFILTRTVEPHVVALPRKLQLPDRRSLARHAEAIPGSWSRRGAGHCPRTAGRLADSGHQSALAALRLAACSVAFSHSAP